jgi:hypothetical protein
VNRIAVNLSFRTAIVEMILGPTQAALRQRDLKAGPRYQSTSTTGVFKVEA